MPRISANDEMYSHLHFQVMIFCQFSPSPNWREKNSLWFLGMGENAIFKTKTSQNGGLQALVLGVVAGWVASCQHVASIWQGYRLAKKLGWFEHERAGEQAYFMHFFGMYTHKKCRRNFENIYENMFN